MSASEALFRDRVAAFLAWEKIKLREKILIDALFWSLVLSLPALFFRHAIAPGAAFFLFPSMLFAAGVLWGYARRRWTASESLRALFRLDRRLKMDDRALTAWDVLERARRSAAEELVLEEAAARLGAFDPRDVFTREISWRAIAAPGLVFVWAATAWLDPSAGWMSQADSRVMAAARALKAFLEPVEEKAELEGLRQSVELARNLKEIAQRALRKEIGEEGFKRAVESAVERAQSIRPDGLSDLDAALFPISRAGLEDLGAEIAELKRQLGPLPAPGADKASDALVKERLGQFPRLEQALERLAPGKTAAGEMDPQTLQSLLEQLDARLKAQLERLTQERIQEFAAAVLGGGEGDEARRLARDGLGERESGGGENKDRLGSLPGADPGEKRAGSESALRPTSGGPSQVRGTIGEGERTRVKVKGQNPVGESKERIETVPANYRRQVERDLAREEIPDSLKETIKKYFLSLGEKKGS
ncbi:MAG TPA: hypothetical protein VNL14_02735 [Candidatus Acidoferrales bacterium]|nr:hypothetical protein [Candidatus Acidoferrales bacterium]